MATTGEDSLSSGDSEPEHEYTGTDQRNCLAGYQFEPERLPGSDSEESYQGDIESEASEPDDVEDGREGNLDWCLCGKCDYSTLSRAKEHTCCRENLSIRRIVNRKDLECITDHQEFPVLCLVAVVLRNVLICLNKISFDNWQIEPPTIRSLRWAAYKQFTWWIYGHLGVLVRRVIPACAIYKIRMAFENPEGVPYEPYYSDPEDDD